MYKLKQGRRVEIVGIDNIPERTYGTVCGIYGEFYIIKIEDWDCIRDYNYGCIVLHPSYLKPVEGPYAYRYIY